MQYRNINIDEFYSCIPGYSNYLVSNTGKVYSKFTNKIIKPHTHNGYQRIEIRDDFGVRRKFFVHRLVVFTFGDKNGNQYIDDNSDVDHIDENKTNNNINNLEIITHKENMNRKYRIRGAWKYEK